MSTEFPRTLSLLRQEKAVSQRVAAAELGISQALLSHYENGAREPGLAFLVRVADYYEVSTDYLLGRTMSRDGGALHPDEIPDVSADKDNVLRGSALAMLQKKLLVNSVALIFDVLGKIGNNSLISTSAGYLSVPIYKLFRLLYCGNVKNPGNFFSVPAFAFSDLSDAEAKLNEYRLQALIGKDDLHIPELSHAELTSQYNALAPSLLTLLHGVGEKIGNNLNP